MMRYGDGPPGGPLDTPSDLINACAQLYAWGMAPATSGNFSLRAGEDAAWMTASGRHKGQLTLNDMLRVTLTGEVVGTAGEVTTGRPSAETALHLALYQRDPSIGCVLHVHSFAASVMGTLVDVGRFLELTGWELQKALPGIATHRATVLVPVVDNTQDIDALAVEVDGLLDTYGVGADLAPINAYIIRGHGLYTWGKTLADAMRHVEAYDHLLRCELERARLTR